MDPVAPLRPELGDELSLSDVELVDRVAWLIRVRWLAFVGVTTTILIARAAFESELPWALLLATAFAIPLYNLVFHLVWSRVRAAGEPHIESASAHIANAQISCDLVVLSLLIHFSGGLENLFGFYFVFHAVIASMLLSRRAAFAQATLAVVAFGAVVLGEYSGIIPHYRSPVDFVGPGVYHNATAVLAAMWVMSTTLYVTVYFATSIASRLRWREGQVAALSRGFRLNAERLRVACDRLVESEHAKSAYTRKVAHELRSPLAAVDGLLRSVIDGLQGEVSDEAKDAIGRARHRTNELLALVRDLLSLAAAREALHAAEPSPVDLREVVGEVERLLGPDAAQRGIALQCEVSGDLPFVSGDREGLEELLTNLVSNGIKYSGSGAEVAVKVFPDGSQAVITVSDHGIGIDEDDLDRVFDEFFRTQEARKVTPQGTGIGLSIVKTVAESHGGSVSVESVKGSGTVFTVRLPLT